MFFVTTMTSVQKLEFAKFVNIKKRIIHTVLCAVYSMRFDVFSKKAGNYCTCAEIYENSRARNPRKVFSKHLMSRDNNSYRPIYVWPGAYRARDRAGLTCFEDRYAYPPQPFTLLQTSQENVALREKLL